VGATQLIFLNKCQSPAERETRAARAGPIAAPLPGHLPRIEIVVDIEDHSCPAAVGRCSRGS
jgi:hypothetical protein